MLDRQVIKDFLQEGLRGIRIPKNMSMSRLAEAFCQFIENDYYEWLKDNYKTFFNHNRPDWKWIKQKIK